MTLRWVDGPDVLACGCARGVGVTGLCTEGRRLWVVMQAARHEATVTPSLEAEGAFVAARQALARHIELGQTPAFAPLSLMGLSATQRFRLRLERRRYLRGELDEGGHPHERAHVPGAVIIEKIVGLAAVVAIWATLGYLAARAL